MTEADSSPRDAAGEPGASARDRLAEDGRAAPLWRRSLIVSAGVHVAVIALLVVVPYSIYRAARDDRPAHASAGSGTSGPPQPAPPAQNKGPKTLPDGSPVVPPEQAQRVFDRLLRENENVSPEERERRLVEASAELKKVTNPESLKKISDQFGGWFGVAPRAAAPKTAPPPGSENSSNALRRFDAGTAQIHDVRIRKPPAPPADAAAELAVSPTDAPKTKPKKPPREYEAVLVDAKGESIVVPLTREEGESLHRIFQLVKSNPLLEQIYRDMAAPLLDKLLRDVPPGVEAPSRPPAP